MFGHLLPPNLVSHAASLEPKYQLRVAGKAVRGGGRKVMSQWQSSLNLTWLADRRALVFVSSNCLEDAFSADKGNRDRLETDCQADGLASFRLECVYRQFLYLTFDVLMST